MATARRGSTGGTDDERRVAVAAGRRIRGHGAAAAEHWCSRVVAVVLVVAYGGVSFVVYDGIGKAPRACWPADRANTPDSFKVPAEFDQALAAANLMPVPQDVAFHSRDPQIPNAKLAALVDPGRRRRRPRR